MPSAWRQSVGEKWRENFKLATGREAEAESALVPSFNEVVMTTYNFLFTC